MNITHILDTDCFSLFRSGNTYLEKHIRERDIATIAVTILTVEEQLNGWYDLLRGTNESARLAAIYSRMTSAISLLNEFSLLTFDEPAIHRYLALKSLKLNIGKYDLRIAAIALQLGATVVTRNERDFSRVPGLSVHDWSKE